MKISRKIEKIGGNKNIRKKKIRNPGKSGEKSAENFKYSEKNLKKSDEKSGKNQKKNPGKSGEKFGRVFFSKVC